MAEESKFVELAHTVAKQVLPPHLSIERGAVLLYQITLDDQLEVTVNLKSPKRGDAAFQTDLCVFEENSKGIRLPRVVLEFKAGISTHDVLTYSAKARKHKQVYPYLRYGVVVSNEAVVPHRFFIHNEALDFFAALKNTKKDEQLRVFFSDLLEREVETSKLMERIAFGDPPQFFRSEIEVEWRASHEPSAKSDDGGRSMSIYDPLRDYLRACTFRQIELSFPELEKIIGRRLPASADRPQWWANQVAPGRPQREAWRAAGFDAFLVAGSRKVQFRRAP